MLELESAVEAEARLHLEYSYLQECHGGNSIRAAVGCCERAIELDPRLCKPHYQLIFARSALHESDRVLDLYCNPLAASSAGAKATTCRGRRPAGGRGGARR